MRTSRWSVTLVLVGVLLLPSGVQPFLARVSADGGSSFGQPFAAVQGVAPELLNVRDAPDRTAPIVTALAEGTEVLLSGESRSADGYVWRRISTVDGATVSGWAVQDYLSATRAPVAVYSPPQKSPRPSSQRSAIVTAPVLNVRAAPSLDAPIVGVLNTGQQVTVLESPASSDEYVWWRVSSAQAGIAGWCVAMALVVTPDAGEASAGSGGGVAATVGRQDADAAPLPAPPAVSVRQDELRAYLNPLVPAWRSASKLHDDIADALILPGGDSPDLPGDADVRSARTATINAQAVQLGAITQSFPRDPAEAKAPAHAARLHQALLELMDSYGAFAEAAAKFTSTLAGVVSGDEIDAATDALVRAERNVRAALRALDTTIAKTCDDHMMSAEQCYAAITPIN